MAYRARGRLRWQDQRSPESQNCSMTRHLAVLVLLLGEAVAPRLQAGCGRYCSVPAVRVIQVVQPVVNTFTELLVPAAAVSFQYFSPAAEMPSRHASGVTNSQPTAPAYAAEPFEDSVAPASSAMAGAASVVQSRCYSCHGASTRGGVSLFGPNGPSRNGQPLSKAHIWDVVRQGRMPPTGPLSPAEKASLISELLK